MGKADSAGPFGLGCTNLGSVSSRTGVRLVHQALDLGIRFFDTADAYGAGGSELVVGRALQRRRDQAFVATKGGYLFRERTGLEQMARSLARPAVRQVARFAGSDSTARLAGSSGYAAQDFSAPYLRLALEGSLRRLGTDYVDLYQLHGPRGVCADDVMALMVDLRSEGKIRGFGVGLESVGPAMDWLGTGALASIQLPFGVLDPEAGEEVIPWANAHGVPVVARGVFAGGLLTERPDGDQALLRPGQPELRTAIHELASAAGVDVLQVAAWFVTSRPGVTTVLVGTTSARHLEQSLRYVRTRPADEMLPLIEALLALAGPDRTSDCSPLDQGGA